MKNLKEARRKTMRTRIGLFCGILGMGLGVVLTGAFNIEVKDGQAWRGLAERQRLRRLHVTPKRGTIYDRNGTPLAISVEVPSVSIDAKELLRGIEDEYLERRARQYAERIAVALHVEVDAVLKRLLRRRRFAWLKRRVTPDEIAAVEALRARDQRDPVRGLVIEGEGRRFYPHRELAGPLLGFVSPDGVGRDGIELALDEQLRGHEEEIRGLRDRAGRLIFAEGIQDESALAGHEIHLTIDQGIQFIAERELAAAMKTHEAIGGSVIVADPGTGEILAMANAPGFNPNDYNMSTQNARRNRAVVDRFEPGSTMKVFSMAAALAARKVKPSDSIYCEEGHMPIDNVVIHDTHISKWLSPTEIMQISSNIGIAKISLGLGERKLYDGLRRFGFGERSGIALPGEAVGTLRPRGRPWVPVETASAAFGQGISTSNLQLAMALIAVANKGRLLEPLVVRRVTDSAGAVLKDASPRVRRRVISARVARVLTDMMTSVTEGHGTGVEGAIPGYRVAGKTATAQKVDPATGRYDDTHYVASFIGFVPASRPRLVVTVVLDEPMAGTTSGGAVAAPVFRRVAEAALRYMGVRPRGTRTMKLNKVAKYAQKKDPAQVAYAAIKENANAGNEEPDEIDTPAAVVPPGTKRARVPEIKDLPMRTALKKLREAGFEPKVHGSGRLVRSVPQSGELAPIGGKVALYFEPPI